MEEATFTWREIIITAAKSTIWKTALSKLLIDAFEIRGFVNEKSVDEIGTVEAIFNIKKVSKQQNTVRQNLKVWVYKLNQLF